MAQIDNLHEIIDSLTQSEKRYFSIYCSRHVIGEENKSLKLFNLVSSQDVYDPEAVMRQLSFVNTPDRLKRKKHQLYRLLLKSMAFYHSEDNSDLRLLEVAQQVQFLYSKGLYRQCIQLIDKAETEAIELEKYSALVVLLECRRRVLHRLADATGVQRSLQTLKKAMQQYDSVLNVMLHALSIHEDVSREGVFRSQEVADRTARKLTVMEGLPMDGSFMAKYYQISAQGIYFSAIGEHGAHMEADRSLVQLFQDYPKFIKDWPTAYAFSLHNLCNALFADGKMQEHRTVLGLIENFKATRMGERDRDFLNHLEVMTFEHGLISAIYAGEFTTAIQLVDGFMPRLNSSSVTETSRIPLLYDIAYLYFLVGDYRECQKLINRILLDERAKSRNDLIGFAELMNILVHFEREHEQLAEYLERSLKRRLIADDRLYPAERIILHLMKQIASKPDPGLVTMHLEHAISEFKAMRQDPYERDVWQYFDFISWLEAKRKGMTMAEVFKERMKVVWK